MSSDIDTQAHNQDFYKLVVGLKMPAMPDSPAYTQSELEILPQYTRETYTAATGKSAPPFDPQKPIKTWFVPVPIPGAMFEYLYINARDANDPIKIGKISRDDAAQVNLTGRPAYPPYVIAPTPAVIVGKDLTYERPLAAVELCTEDQARQLAAELNSTAEPSISYLDGPLFTTDWRGETRRPYFILVGGKWLNAGRLLDMENANGVGHPGSWVMIGTVPTWFAAALADGSETTYDRLLPPLRPLQAVEKVHLSGFGPALIYRTDKESTLNPQPVAAIPTELADFLLDLKQMLTTVSDQVSDLHNLLGIVSTANR